MKTVITFGTFDLLHIGHVRLIERAAAFGDRLVVGVSSDALNEKKKGKSPTYSQEERMEIIKALRHVDDVFLEVSLEKKHDYVVQHSADILVMGDDWKGYFDDMAPRVVYLSRTESISTSETVAKLQSNNK